MRAFAIIFLVSASFLVSQNAEAPAWRTIGPGGGGAQFRPTVSPHDPNTALIACDMTGAYITHDGGRRWREFNLRTRVDAFAFDPVNPKVIYAGSSGLFRSEDAGAKWTLIFPNPKSGVRERMAGDHADQSFLSGDNWPGGRIQAIRVDPEDTDRIFIGIQSRGLHLFYSTDAGKTWKPGGQVPGQAFRKLYIDPTSPRGNRRLLVFTDTAIRLARTEGFQLSELPSPAGRITDADCGLEPASKKPVCYLSSPARWEGETLSTGVFKSEDLGQTWRGLVSGLDKDLVRGRAPNFTMLATSEKDARVVYLSVQRHPEGENWFGIMKTEDAGSSWAWVLKANRDNPSNKKVGWVERSYGPGWGEAPLGLGVAASDPKVCYATDMGTSYRTADGGRTWQQVYSHDDPDGSSTTSGLDVTTTYGVHFDPFDENHIVISYTDIGLHHSLNGGRTWLHSVKGVPRPWINTCYWVVFDPEVKGRAWSVWGNGHDLPRPKMFRGNFDRFLGGVCRTDDGAKTWRQSNEGMPPNCVSTHIVLDPHSPAASRTLYVAGFGRGVFKSTDGGQHWMLKNNGIKGNLNAWELVLLPDGTLYLLVARGLANGREVDGALYKSADGAETWQAVALPSGVNAPNDLVFDPKEPRRMFLACWPRTIDGTERYGGVYSTEDGGATWRSSFDASAHAYGLAIDPDNPRTLFLNTFDSAAYRSDDGGRSWRRLEGYNFKWGHRPVLDPHHKGMLYLTTFGSSVWYGPAAGVPGAFEDIYPFK